jgi:uncharacterized protein YgiM (DUF1202 family)
MRPYLIAWSCWLLCLGGTAMSARGADDFPYSAYVVADDVYVRSGPGLGYYPTDKISRGQAVEVYRHDPGGWCAIRPLEGSFTWVSGRFLRPTEDGLAVVTEDDVSARVGSRLSDARDVIHVRLRKGEVVEILEAPNETDGGRWYKIAPPSGEFRWIAAKYLSRDCQCDEAPPREPSKACPAGRRPLTPKEFQEELERIELELSTMLIEDPTHWSFDELKERTAILHDGAQTAVEQGRAQLLAKRIARFEDIKQRQEAVLAMRGQSGRGRNWGRLPGGAEPEKEILQADPRFDGVGRLAQVVSPKLGAPRYALLGDAGEVLCYVSPAPGVNLQHYLGRRIGVVGTRGQVPEQNAALVTARHVAPLDGPVLR